MADGSRALVCAADADRDQSYFLFATTREQLDYLRFPLGDMTKPQTRELARRFGLEVADKQDSQDICFVPTGRYTDIIGRLRPNADRARRYRRSRRPRHRPASGHRSFHRRPAPGIGHRRQRRRSMWCGWMPPAAASWSGRARRCGWIASCCATSTGSATARSIARSARVSRFSCGCDRPARRSRRGCARRRWRL